MTEWYKKYRPKKLEQVVGNRETVEVLRQAIRRERVPHTLLFSGPSGCGKTTLARIVRRELGCAPEDFRELDVASFRGIDTIRELQEQSRYAPLAGPCRVFLLDEVHMLTREGQNATLKILEDTPTHVYFLLCTTDPGKLLPTIRTRCTHLPVRLLADDEVRELVGVVSAKEEVEVSKASLEALVEAAEGSARSALVLLEKVAHLPEGQRAEALAQARERQAQAIDLCRALVKKERWGGVATILKRVTDDPEQVRRAVLGYARSVLLGGGPQAAQAYTVLCAFENHMYDSGAAGLARASFEAISGGG